MEANSVPGLKKAMKAAGATQAGLAQKMDVSVITVSRWVRGEIEPPISTVKALAGILGCSVQELLGLESQELDGCKIIGVRQEGKKKIITIEIDI